MFPDSICFVEQFYSNKAIYPLPTHYLFFICFFQPNTILLKIRQILRSKPYLLLL
ncbi:hypothetical protein HMPREF9394_1575 [Streptococcus sanguinis SK1057]|nr:hypothetical protein HMPREF9394_1575 [Streptococcus sanguinis SK1057]